MVNFKIYDVLDWITNYYNTHIAQCLKKQMQSYNETWPVNRIKRDLELVSLPHFLYDF